MLERMVSNLVFLVLGAMTTTERVKLSSCKMHLDSLDKIQAWWDDQGGSYRKHPSTRNRQISILERSTSLSFKQDLCSGPNKGREKENGNIEGIKDGRVHFPLQYLSSSYLDP